MINKRKYHQKLFIAFDALMAALAWSVFFIYRKNFIEPDKFGYKVPLELDDNFYIGLILVPVYWVTLYFLAGHYKDVWRKSRIHEISIIFSITIIGVALLFFALLLDDEVRNYQAYYKTTLVLFTLHFSLTLLNRFAQATFIIHRLRNQQIGFNTIVVGNNSRSLALVKELVEPKNAEGFLLKGYVSINGDKNDHVLNGILPFLGEYEHLPEIIREYKISEVIIGIESTKHNELNKVTNLLEDQKVNLKIIPDLYDMVSGQVRLNNIIGSALIEVNHDVMPEWQKVVKRLIDISVSLFVLIIFLPVFMVLALAVKLTSEGPVFFKQIRLGYLGKPFHIYKFRTMVVNAEADGPRLSSKQDKRITPVGKWLRKYRLDEIPQFWNVLVGEMSLVGPRPERKFFVDQIVKLAPHYKHLHRVKPGITSWGQVKYGYAENVEQMIERLKFDILYIENRSIAVDFRILIYTIKTILQGRGR